MSLSKGVPAAIFLSVLLGTLGCASNRTQLCVSQLGRTGFLHGLLFPQGTARTPTFNDYTEGSYHVEKMDLVEGVRVLRAQEPIRGLLVYGPEGPLWTFYVLLFVEEDDQVRLNTLIFPHARITLKTTRLLTTEDYREAIAGLSSRRFMLAGPPAFESVGGERIADASLDWHYSFLMADWSDGTERLWHGMSESMLSKEEFLSLVDDLNELLADGTTTYTTSLPEGYETSICPEAP